VFTFSHYPRGDNPNMKFKAISALALLSTVSFAACSGGGGASPELARASPAQVNPAPASAQSIAGAVTLPAPTGATNVISLPTSAGASSGPITVTEAGYSGAFSVNASACAGVVAIAPVNANGPNATFTASQVGAGSCVATIADALGHSTTIAVSSTVTTAQITIPGFPIQVVSSVSLPAIAPGGGVLPDASLAVSESGYSGAFSISGCGGIATIAPVNANGPNATFTLTQVAAGSCALTITDTHGQTATVTVNSTTTTAIIAG
jgi:hypothetical protein